MVVPAFHWITAGVFLVVAAAEASAQPLELGLSSSIGSFADTSETPIIYFSHFDAPYLSEGYRDRIDNLVGSITLSGTISNINQDALDQYDEILDRVQPRQMRLTAEGKKLLDVSRLRLIAASGELSESYTDFQNQRKSISRLMNSKPVDYQAIRSSLISFFSHGQALATYSAISALSSLNNDAYYEVLSKSIANTARQASANRRMYLPNPDDIDLVNDWKEISVRAEGSDFFLSGQYLYVDIINSGADPIIENMIAYPESEQKKFLADRLLFVRNMRVVENPRDIVENTAHQHFLPLDKLQVYGDAFMDRSSGLFLFAVELRQVFP